MTHGQFLPSVPTRSRPHLFLCLCLPVLDLAALAFAAGRVLGWTLLPLAFMQNRYWSLIHEAIHDHFRSPPGINMLFGRAATLDAG